MVPDSRALTGFSAILPKTVEDIYPLTILIELQSVERDAQVFSADRDRSPVRLKFITGRRHANLRAVQSGEDSRTRRTRGPLEEEGHPTAAVAVRPRTSAPFIPEPIRKRHFGKMLLHDRPGKRPMPRFLAFVRSIPDFGPDNAD